MTVPVLALDAVSKRYPGAPPVHALRNVTLRIDRGELVGIVGPSGSGKSTLLHIAGTLDSPTEGSVAVDGHSVASLGDAEAAAIRARRIGFVFQQFHLLPGLSALENVALALLYAGVRSGERRRRAAALLDRVGLAKRAGHRPSQLSGGERQRVAIARALVGEPAYVLADEPTGNLDSKTGGEILELLQQSVADYQQTLVMVTHEARAAAIADRILFLADGLIVKELGQSDAGQVLDAMNELAPR